MSINDERFEELLQGESFDPKVQQIGQISFTEKDAFLDRLIDELNADSKYAADVDLFFEKNLAIESKLEGIKVGLGLIFIDYGAQKLSGEDAIAVFLNVSDEDAIKQKKLALYNLYKDDGATNFKDDVAAAISLQISTQPGQYDPSNAGNRRYSGQGLPGTVVDKDKLNETLKNVRPPADPIDEANTLPEDITPGFRKQCVLMSKIDQLHDFYHSEVLKQPNDNLTNPGVLAAYHQAGYYLWGGNIVPLTMKTNEYFIPLLTSSRFINGGFFKGNVISGNEQIGSKRLSGKIINKFEICFVQKDDNGIPREWVFDTSEQKAPIEEMYSNILTLMKGEKIGNLNRTSIALSFASIPNDPNASLDTAKNYYNNLNDAIKTSIYSQIAKAGAGGSNVKKLKGFNINFEGTNPSTARNDVKVDLTYELTSLNVLTNKVKCRLKGSGPGGETKEFSLSDLVTFPYYESDAEGSNKIFRSQYDPNHNRIRIYLYTQIQGDDASTEQKQFNKANVMALDLTLVDHDISKSGDGLDTISTFKISYRGYFDTLLSTPLIDVLIDKDIIEKRKQREEVLKQAVTKGCSLSDVQRIISELNVAVGAETKQGYTRIIQSLVKGGRVYTATVDGSQIANIYRPPTATEKEEKNNVTAPSITSGNFSTFDPSTAKLTPVMPTLAPTFDESGQNDVAFFYLFDLLDIASETLYDRASSRTTGLTILRRKEESSDYVKNVQYRFFLGPLSVPIVSGSSTNKRVTRKIINIGHVPISLDYFIEWYKENVTDKQLDSFPLTMFIRQLCERLVTNLLNEFCFSDSLEPSVLIRTSLFEDSYYYDSSENDENYIKGFNTFGEQQYYKSMETNFAINNTPLKLSDNQIGNKQPLFRTNVKDGMYPQAAPDKKPICCIAIYAQGRSDVYSSGIVEKMNTDNTLPLVNVSDTDDAWYLKNWSFSKVQQQGLREARYFNSSLNQITQLAAVYDITMTFSHVMLTLFPGQIFRMQIKQLGDHTNPNSVSFQLGLGGYHLITKVSHSFDGGSVLDPNIRTTITMRWFSSGSRQEILRQVRRVTEITDPAARITDSACDELTKYADEISADAVRDAQDPSYTSTFTNTNIEAQAASQFNTAAEALATTVYGIPFGDHNTFNSSVAEFANKARSGPPVSTPIKSNSTGGYTYTSGKDGIVTVTDANGNVTAKLDKNNQIIE